MRWERRSLLTANESFLIHSIARAQAKVPGEFAEVGVYEGGSARITSEVKGDKELHLFDTFAFMEFLADKPEKLIELPTTQCMVVKL